MISRTCGALLALVTSVAACTGTTSAPSLVPTDGATAFATAAATTAPETASPRPSDVPASSPPPGSEPAGSAAPTSSGALASDAPATHGIAWRRLDAGSGPAAREDHTWTVDGDGASAYLFGGRAGGEVHGDLWRFDLASDTWQRLDPPGRRPEARFGHTATWADGVGLVVWSGQAGSRFFADLWAYDPAAGRWRALPDAGAVPAARYGSCAVLAPDGRLWISHGFTDDGRFADTRAYDLAAGSWSDVTASGATPVERCLHDCLWTDRGLLLYAGQTNGVPALGDLWTRAADGAWSQAAEPEPAPRQLYALAASGGFALVFGGGGDDGEKLADAWLLDLAALAWTRLRPIGDGPSGRSGATLVADDARGRFLLFGGLERAGPVDDLWQADVRTAG